jgi:general secretion pathway protein D
MAAFSPLSMARRLYAPAVLAMGLALSACTTGNPSSLLEGVGNVDLSPRQPTSVEQNHTAAVDGKRQARYEFYPSRDSQPEGRTGRQYAQMGEGVTASGEGYDINLEEARIPDVVKMVLGDVLKTTYFIDPRVDGTVTLSTGRPVTEDELLRVLELALQMNDAILTKDGDSYMVIPGGEAFEGGGVGTADFGRDIGEKPPGYGITVLPLRHVRAQNVVELIDSYAARAGSVRAIVRNNVVLMRGTAAEREALRDVILAFDVDWMRGQSAAIATLTTTGPEEIIPELESIFLSASQGEDNMLVRFAPLQHLNAVLILGSDRSRVREAMEWVARLDREGGEATDYYVYRVQNGKAIDLARILSNTFGRGEGAPAAPEREIVPDQPPAQVATQRPGQQLARAGGLGQQDPALQGPSELADRSGVVTYSLAEDTRITASPTNNTLVIRAPPRQYRKILAVLRQIDSPALQVMINTTIAEVTLNDTLRYGVQAFLRSDDVALGLFTAGLPIGPIVPGLNFIAGSRKDPSLIIDALSAVTSVRVVSSPSLVVVDNQQAVIKVGDQVPIRTQEVISTESDTPPIVSTFEYRDTGIILRVTPRVSGTGLVTMEISQELLATQPGAEGAGDNPTFSQRVINSTVSVYSRQTVVLGGLIAGQEDREKLGVPVIDHIPVIGDLVGRTDNERRRTELIVFITPQVIRDSIEASQVSEELRAKLRLLADPNQGFGIAKP